MKIAVSDLLKSDVKKVKLWLKILFRNMKLFFGDF